MSDSAPTVPSLPLRVLCIGAGFAGIEVMRRLGSDRRFAVTLVDRQNHHLFQPLLYQVATASLAMPDIARTVRQLAAPHANISVFQDEILGFDLDGRRAIGRERGYDYDRLILATGARTGFFGNDHWAAHVFGLKCLDEAYALRRHLILSLERAELTDDAAERERLMTIVIVGGGPTGVELAGAIMDLVTRSMARNFRRIDPGKLRVLLIQGNERLLPPYPPQQSAYAQARLEAAGVTVLTRARVTDIGPQRVTLQDGREFQAGTIVWAAGVEASALTRQLGVEPADKGGRIRPLPDLSLPGRPEVFLTGDLVALSDANGLEVPGVAPAAIQMAELVVRHLDHEAAALEMNQLPDPPEQREAFVYRDKGMMAIIGKNAAVVSAGKVQLRGFPAWFAWLFVHVMSLVGFRNKMAVLFNWWGAYIHDRSGAQVVAVADDDFCDPPPERRAGLEIEKAEPRR